MSEKEILRVNKASIESKSLAGIDGVAAAPLRLPDPRAATRRYQNSLCKCRTPGDLRRPENPLHGRKCQLRQAGAENSPFSRARLTSLPRKDRHRRLGMAKRLGEVTPSYKGVEVRMNKLVASQKICGTYLCVFFVRL